MEQRKILALSDNVLYVLDTAFMYFPLIYFSDSYDHGRDSRGGSIYHTITSLLSFSVDFFDYGCVLVVVVIPVIAAACKPLMPSWFPFPFRICGLFVNNHQ